MRSLLNRRYAYLATLGIHVHPEHEWRVELDLSWRKYLYYPNRTVRFHTVQKCVWVDGVNAKEALIHRGLAPFVTVTSASEFGANDLWITNGHHTLVAYLHLQRKPYLRHFDRAAVGRGHRVRIPRFDPTAIH